MARGDVLVSPWVWQTLDYQGNALTITVPFNDSTRALVNSTTVVRDAGCVYGHLYIGTGTDGTVETTTHSFAIPVGTTTVNARQMGNKGLNTIEDVLTLQITAGP
jgi:hypothetical protein